MITTTLHYTASPAFSYDAESGNVWHFVPSPAHKDTLEEACWGMLQCEDHQGVPFWLGPDLRCHDRKSRGAPWKLEGWKPYRDENRDLSVRIWTGDGRLLCSSGGADPELALLKPEKAGMKAGLKGGGAGAFVWNDAWECTPDGVDIEDLDDDEDFIQVGRGVKRHPCCGWRLWVVVMFCCTGNRKVVACRWV